MKPLPFIPLLLLAFSLTALRADDARREPPGAAKDLELPETTKTGGARFIDLNGDSHPDLVVSNAKHYGVYLFVPKEREKKNLQWFEGWTEVLREGHTGDANSLPLIQDADGKDTGVTFHDQAMWTADGKKVAYSELLKVPGPAPRSPQESLAALHLKPGFTATLIACEPLVQDPVFLDWDDQGRLWVVEMGDYPFAPGEKTTNGETGQERVSALQTGRVKVLTDADGDGIYDHATTFLEGLHHPNSLAFWKGGVFIATTPEIIYAEDTDGDGKCDRSKSWFTGFKEGNPQHLVNGFEWGLDGWFYGANGDSGGDVVAEQTGAKVSLGANDFRFNPQTGVFEIEAGRSQYGKWRDDWGNWFGNNNSVMGWHYYLPLHCLARNPDLAVKSVRGVINDAKVVYPASPPVRRFNWASATNTLTSGCCPMPYRDTVFGEDGRDVIFICEPANNLVHREVLNCCSSVITSMRHPQDKESEFIASEDNWFRPTCARTGPDGALYVVDFYRQVLEHPEWIPAQIVKGLDLRAGEDRGRIYRIAKETAAEASENVRKAARIARAPTMRSGNGWVRDQAMRRIIEQQDTTRVPELKEIASGKDPAPRVQALWTLALLKALDTELLKAALTCTNANVRVNALRCAADTGQGALLPADLLPALVKDPAAPVRFALALSLGDLPAAQRVPLITALAKQDASDEAIITALRSSSAGIDLPAEVTAIFKTKPKEAKAAPVLPVITNLNPDRQKVVQQYASAGTLQGDATRGHLLYSAVCSACHKLKNEGNEIGPDLGMVAAKPVDQIIESVLDPNRAVEQRYTVQTVVTKDQKEHIGLIVEENSNNLTLRTGTGTELILLKDIASRKGTTRSLMPEGLESVLKPADLADIMAWIRAK